MKNKYDLSVGYADELGLKIQNGLCNLSKERFVNAYLPNMDGKYILDLGFGDDLGGCSSIKLVVKTRMVLAIDISQEQLLIEKSSINKFGINNGVVDFANICK